MGGNKQGGHPHLSYYCVGGLGEAVHGRGDGGGLKYGTNSCSCQGISWSRKMGLLSVITWCEKWQKLALGEGFQGRMREVGTDRAR